MIEQSQKVVDSETGDCFRACMASLLELPNSDELPNDHSDRWLFVWWEFLARFGLTLGHDSKAIWRHSYWIASVPSKNYNRTHAVVMQGHKIAFDPSTKKRYRKGTSMSGKVSHGYWLEVTDVGLVDRLGQYRRGLIETIPSQKGLE